MAEMGFTELNRYYPIPYCQPIGFFESIKLNLNEFKFTSANHGGASKFGILKDCHDDRRCGGLI